jgi:hypothetical protein
MADWLCPHTPDICDYAETCATKLSAELALLKGAGPKPVALPRPERQFLQVTSGGWSQVIAVDQIARIFKNVSNHPEDTSIKLKDGTTVAVTESIKTIQARIGCELLP